MKKYITLLALAAVLIPATAHAARTVTSPYVEEGTLRLKSKTGIGRDDERASRDGALQQKFGAEYGFTGRFSIEVEANIDNPGDSNNSKLNAVEAKGKVLFTEKGKYWLDAGARLAYEHALEDDAPDSVELRFILAKDTEKFRHTANFSLAREVGDNSGDETEGGFSWSSRYKWKKEFEPGFEMYNNFGSLSDSPRFQDQDHSIGPVAYGKIGDIKYEAGYLAGFSDNAYDGRFKFILEYGIKF